MVHLRITHIRKSGFNGDFDLITAIILRKNNCKNPRPLSVAKKSPNGLLVLESATADGDLPAIGVQKGDQFIHMWAKLGHEMKIGEEIRFDDMA